MSTASEAGVYEWTLNGAALLPPKVFEVHNELAQNVTVTSGRPRLDALWCGDGLPNVIDRLEWSLEYDLDGDLGSTIATLERVRTKGGIHTFADWKMRRYTYTARSGQQFFYLPRQDAFSLGYAGHTLQATYGAKVWRNDVALTVTYQPTVSSGDVVPTGHVWIGNTSVVHPEAGFLCAPFKVGTPNTIYDDILVEFHALYHVAVTGVPTLPFEGGVGREDKNLYLTELAGS